MSSPEVRDAIEKYALTEVQEDPPFRRYYISRQGGLDLLAENDQVVDIQIFVQPKKRFSAFGESLPFALEKGMNQAQVHQLLGPPAQSDEFDSKYEMPEIGAKLSVSFDDSTNLKYISIGTLI